MKNQNVCEQLHQKVLLPFERMKERGREKLRERERKRGGESEREREDIELKLNGRKTVG